MGGQTQRETGRDRKTKRQRQTQTETQRDGGRQTETQTEIQRQKAKETQRDRDAERWRETDRDTDRKTKRHRERDTHRWTETQRETGRGRKTKRHRETNTETQRDGGRRTETQTEIQRQKDKVTERLSEGEHSLGVRRCRLELIPGFSWPSSGDHWSLGLAQGALGSLLAASLQILDTFSLCGSSSEGSLGSACGRPWHPGRTGSGEKAQEDRGGGQEEGPAWRGLGHQLSCLSPLSPGWGAGSTLARVTLVSPRDTQAAQALLSPSPPLP